MFVKRWCSDVSFLGLLDFSEFLSLGHHVLILNTHDTTTLSSSEGDVVVEHGDEVLLEGFEILQVLLGNFGHSNASGGFGVAELSKSGLSFHEAEWDLLLSAESWEEDHQLWWVNIVGHDDKLGFAFFNKGGNMVETEFEVVWFRTDVISLVSSLSGFSFLLESLSLLCFGLW